MTPVIGTQRLDTGQEHKISGPGPDMTPTLGTVDSEHLKLNRLLFALYTKRMTSKKKKVFIKKQASKFYS